jgi:hypothetical protein
MNEERVAIINSFLEERLALADASRLLDALRELEAGTDREIVEPPCPPPPWREADDGFDALLSPEGCPLLFPSATRQIVTGLAEGEMWPVVSRLAMLDVAALAEFWSGESRPGYMGGGVNLEETPEGLKGRPGKGGRIHYSGDTLAMRIFWHPVPFSRPEQTLTLEREEEGRRVAYTVHPDRETVTTALGKLDDCLRMTHRLGQPEETRTFWLARGIGPVRAVFERAGATRFAVELTGFRTGGESFFPRAGGDWWRFDGTHGGFPHRELWRALAPQGEGEVPWLSLAACPHSIEE